MTDRIPPTPQHTYWFSCFHPLTSPSPEIKSTYHCTYGNGSINLTPILAWQTPNFSLVIHLVLALTLALNAAHVFKTRTKWWKNITRFGDVVWHHFIFVKACDCPCLCKACTRVSTLERDVTDILSSQSKHYTNYIYQHWVQSPDSQFYLLVHFWNLVPMCWKMDVLVCVCMWTWLWLYCYVPPVYACAKNRALDLSLLLPSWHGSHTGKLTFDLGCLVGAT